MITYIIIIGLLSITIALLLGVLFKIIISNKDEVERMRVVNCLWQDIDTYKRIIYDENMDDSEKIRLVNIEREKKPF